VSRVESRIERIILETDRHRIVGDLTLPREGYRSRLSDFLNQGELDFIALSNAIVTPLGGGTEVERDFVAVARAHVRLAHPHDRGGDPGLG
jgi:hypothetical protein